MRWALPLVALALLLPSVGCRSREEALQEQAALIASRLGVAPERLRYVGRREHDGPLVHDLWVLSGSDPDPAAFVAQLGIVQGELTFYRAREPEAALPLQRSPRATRRISREQAERIAVGVAAALWPTRYTAVDQVRPIGPPPGWCVEVVEGTPTKDTLWRRRLKLKDDDAGITWID